MALDNLISVSFTDEELTKISTAIEQINTILKGKAINLTPEDMGKARDAVPMTVDKAESDRD